MRAYGSGGPNTMARLAIDDSPATSLPSRFLLSAPLWGMLAGVLLLIDGDALLRVRWSLPTVALVHVFTLGVLGNLMIGSVLQFLPAAAGVRIGGNPRLGLWLHGLFNLGVLALVAGLHASWRVGLTAAAVLLPLSFLLLGAMTLPGLLLASGQRLLRAGLAVALGFAVLTALLGGALALGLGGWLVLPLAALVDVHASWGVLGWVVVLIASVARVVLPMFLGTGTVPAMVQTTWLGSLPLLLLAGAWQRLAGGHGAWLVATVVVYAALFAVTVLWLLRRVPRARCGSLRRSWRSGLVLLALAALGLLQGPRGGLLAGVLGLAVALPLLVVGMALEIVAFLGWIELHRRCGRGVQLPGVQRLLPEAEKLRALLALLPSALLLVAAVCWPVPWLARSAGTATLLAWLGVWLTLRGVGRRAQHFLRTVEHCA